MSKKTDERRRVVTRFNIAVIALICVIVLTIGLIAASDKLWPSNASGVALDIYFVNPSSCGLTAERRGVPLGTREDMLQNAAAELLRGPSSKKLVKSVPDSVAIEKMALINGSEHALEVYFSDGYNGLSATDELYLRAAVVWTFTGLDFIDNVELLAGGEPLLKANGQDMAYMNRDNLRLDSDFVYSNTELQSLTLYFADGDSLGLTPEARSVAVDHNVPLETYVLQELIKGPSNPALRPTLTAELKIRSVKTDEGICYVDLTSDFLSKAAGAGVNERLAIYSIVNSLTELGSIKKVQFLVEGVKLAQLKDGQIDISSPFERNGDILN